MCIARADTTPDCSMLYMHRKHAQRISKEKELVHYLVVLWGLPLSLPFRVRVYQTLDRAMQHSEAVPHL